MGARMADYYINQPKQQSCLKNEASTIKQTLQEKAFTQTQNQPQHGSLSVSCAGVLEAMYVPDEVWVQD